MGLICVIVPLQYASSVHTLGSRQIQIALSQWCWWETNGARGTESCHCQGAISCQIVKFASLRMWIGWKVLCARAALQACVVSEPCIRELYLELQHIPAIKVNTISSPLPDHLISNHLPLIPCRQEKILLGIWKVPVQKENMVTHSDGACSAQLLHMGQRLGADSLGNLCKQFLPANTAWVSTERCNISPAMNQHGMWVPGQQLWLSGAAAAAEISSSFT